MLLNGNKPILIAGPTASGKSAAALNIAARFNGEIVNADALQVYCGWSVLSARPAPYDLTQAKHHLYGHRDMLEPYSVGAWLREVETVSNDIIARGKCPIIIGGTGLYFLALTQGLANIPEIPQSIKDQADDMAADRGLHFFADDLAKLDPESFQRIDIKNPARTRRAWEVFKATGQGLSFWHDNTPDPLIAEKDAQCLLLCPETDILNTRINARFDKMVELGALDECRAAINSFWDPKIPSCQAIGAKDLISYLQGDVALDDAIESAKTQTRRYAKRQRTWFRARMKNWSAVKMSAENELTVI